MALRPQNRPATHPSVPMNQNACRKCSPAIENMRIKREPNSIDLGGRVHRAR
jgi:hypothetical protein